MLLCGDEIIKIKHLRPTHKCELNTKNSKQKKVESFQKKLHSYITASPDRLASCKCHRKSLIEIKCPFSIRDKKISKSVSDCKFLKVSPEGNVFLSQSHRYYTQVISQMAISEIKKCYFVWTLPRIFLSKIFVSM